MKQLLIDLRACDELKEWAEDKTWEQVYNTCHRGDWLLWLFIRTNRFSVKRLSLARGHCANTVRHLMKDKRSIKAVDIAIAFGEGKATTEDFSAAYLDAYQVINNADNDVDYYAARTVIYENTAACSVDAVINIVEGAIAQSIARKQNQQLTADICRKYLPIEIWNITKQED
jgi:hypothetical protein